MNGEFATEMIFQYLLIFARVGTLMMFITPIAENDVPVNIKLSFALLTTFLIVSSMNIQFPKYEFSIIYIALLIGQEVVVGLILGNILRLIFSAMHIAGMIISFQSGLSSAVMFDPSHGNQGTAIGNFLSTLLMVCVLASDLHLYMIKGIADSYDIFPIMSFARLYNDYIALLIRAISDAFIIGIKISSPFIIVGLLFSISGGILSRLMPQLQVFFVLMPAQILLTLVLLMLSISVVMRWVLSYYEEYLMSVW
jgi:flagellar biosynthetic protein FliR